MTRTFLVATLAAATLAFVAGCNRSNEAGPAAPSSSTAAPAAGTAAGAATTGGEQAAATNPTSISTSSPIDSSPMRR
jgi:hypothetical protein